MYESIFDPVYDQDVYDSLANSECYSNFEVYGASSDPDAIYSRDILQEPDCHKFIEAMNKVIIQHNEQRNWKLVFFISTFQNYSEYFQVYRQCNENTI
jgi:hypothetical protein